MKERIKGIHEEEKKEEEEEKNKESPLANLFDELLKDADAKDCSELVKKVEEVKGEPIEGIHDVTFSILLSKMSTEAQTVLHKLS